MNELGSEIKFEGVNRLLEYPEYKNLEKLQKMISTIEYKEDIIELHHYPKDESKESVYIEVI